MKITLLKSLVMLGAFLCFGLAQAQEVSGTVSDSNGPLAGANVLKREPQTARKPILMATTHNCR